jgi:hypothetical protein
MTCVSRRTIDRPGERRQSPGEWRLALRASLTFLQTCRHQDSLSALAELRAWRQGEPWPFGQVRVGEDFGRVPAFSGSLRSVACPG